VPVYCYIWTALMKSRVYISRRCIVSIPVDSGGVGTYLRREARSLSCPLPAWHSIVVDAISFKDHSTLILRSIYISYLYNVS
jgi:hypothetical protein